MEDSLAILGKVLINKLTKEELSQLVMCWDDGSFRYVMEELLLPEDKKNFPELYM